MLTVSPPARRKWRFKLGTSFSGTICTFEVYIQMGYDIK